MEVQNVLVYFTCLKSPKLPFYSFDRKKNITSRVLIIYKKERMYISLNQLFNY